jgi:hypothetical protein
VVEGRLGHIARAREHRRGDEIHASILKGGHSETAVTNGWPGGVAAIW